MHQEVPHSSVIEREDHSNVRDRVRDVVIGMSDGLTVPFALAAGIAGAGVHTGIIIAAGLAEIAAGSISMGLGGYLAAQGEAEHYDKERKREEWEVDVKPEIEAQEVMDVLESYGLKHSESAPVVASLRTRKKDWVDFMMRFELGLEEPDRRRALTSALTIAASYIAGGLVPLLPYILINDALEALRISVPVTLLALAAFGYVRGKFLFEHPWKSMVQTALVGGLAATAAFLLARFFA